MSTDKVPTPISPELGRPNSPGPSGLRKRASQRAFTFNDSSANTIRRRSSFFSDNLSETPRSFLSSTDDLLLPRVKADQSSEHENAQTTHWHSLPLGLALLPALAGVFFKDGSAVITDVTLLGLAAIFLNWALKLPWEWYHSTQATIVDESDQPSSFQSIIEDEEHGEPGSGLPDTDTMPARKGDAPETTQAEDQIAARHELRIHEISALLACFVSPLLGAWLLHAIRAQLSRPSEGLVSNYNLTIFLLMAELRPLSHLMKMIQRRTLFLQRRVNANAMRSNFEEDNQTIRDFNSRLEELETHVADKVAAQTSTAAILDSPDALVSKMIAQANVDVRKAIQPELDALNRAMRRYEKRMTISAIQVEARLQDVEVRLKDVVVLAAAAQRNADTQPRNFLMTLMNWMSAIVVVPIQIIVDILKFPGRCAQFALSWLQHALRIGRHARDPRAFRAPGKQGGIRPRPVLKKVRDPVQ